MWGFSPTHGPRYREPDAANLYGRKNSKDVYLHPYETRKALEALENIKLHGVETVEAELDNIPATSFRSINRQMNNKLRRPLI